MLALWAVVLAGIGLTRPSFPYNERGQRGVIAITFVLVVIAIGAAIAVAVRAGNPLARRWRRAPGITRGPPRGSRSFQRTGRTGSRRLAGTRVTVEVLTVLARPPAQPREGVR